MKRTWYQLNGMDEFLDVDGTVDRPCYGIFPAEDTAQEVAEYFATIGIETELSKSRPTGRRRSPAVDILQDIKIWVPAAQEPIFLSHKV